MTILIVGDFHIPQRASAINPLITEYFKQVTYELIFCTGDLTSQEILDYLSKLGECWTVRGNMDTIDLPECTVKEIHGVNIGLIHGDQVYPRGDAVKLYKIAKNLKVDVLISGHTHASSALNYRGVLLLNPGSTTGVWGGGDYSGIPEFMVLDVLKPKNRPVHRPQLIAGKLVRKQ